LDSLEENRLLYCRSHTNRQSMRFGCVVHTCIIIFILFIFFISTKMPFFLNE
jgi:hypothetical protein